MRKLLSLALALVMILGLSVTAFADTEIAVNPTGAGNKNVTGKYMAGAESGIIYKIDISWGSMAFTYTSAGKGTWDTDDHTYKNATAAGWSWAEGANKITVTNHSNDGITVTPSYTKDTGFENASMTFDKTSLTLETADNGENGAAGTATNGTITVTPSGSIPEGTSGKIGQITLSIAGTDGSSAGGETTDDKAVITGVEVKVGDTTYQSGDTVTLTSEGEVAFIVKGTNLQNGNANTNLLFLAPNVAHPVTSEDWVINTEGTEATCSIYYFNDQLATLTTAYEILYTNDGDTTRTGSGVKILYEEAATDERAVITGVEVKVGDTTYQSGDTVTLTPNSGNVTLIVKGTNLQNGSMSANWVQYVPSTMFFVTSNYVTFNEDGTEATHTLSPSEFAGCTTAYEIQYSNDGKNWVGSGVKILYDNGLTEDEKAVITGVEIKVGDTTYKSGDTVTLSPNSGNVTLIVKGTNLQNGSMSANWVKYIPSTMFFVTSDYVTFNEDGTEAINTYPATRFESVTTAFEIQYSNDGKNWVGSGVKLLYEESGGETTDDTAVITGVEVKVGDTTYQSGDTVTLSPNSGNVTLIVKGRNLQSSSTSTNWVRYSSGRTLQVGSGQTTSNADGTEATRTLSPSAFAGNTTAYEIQYTNNAGTTWNNSGVKILYDNSLTEDEKAVITGVEVKVGDTTYQSGDTVTLNADSGDVTIIVKGRNLQNGVSSSNKVQYRPGYAVAVASGYRFTFSDDGTEATRTYSSSDFADVTTSFELQYTNEGSNWVGSGVQIIYENSSGYTSVSTPEDLTSSLSAGGNIKLANDITLTSYADITNTVTLDLNNCTLTIAGNGLYVNSGASLTIKNGTVVNADGNAIWNGGGNVNVENCTLTGQANAFGHYPSGTSTLKNCTVNGIVSISGSGTITLSGSINFGSGTAHNTYKGIEVGDTSDGSVICYFDPTNNIFDGIVTNNGDGTWTVTKDS